MRPAGATRLLTRHFFRRFFENDLISPHVDLHENSAVAGATVVSLTLFASVVFGAKYWMSFSPPGVVMVESAADNFLFLTISMWATALVAALQWDALSLDARDAANLGPLPITLSVMVRAKLLALLLFGAAFAVALNAFPALILQTATTSRMPVGFSGLLRLMSAHAVAAMLASAFGFLAILAGRELLRAVMGQLFARVSTVLQGALVLACSTGLLLSPASAAWLKTWMRTDLPAWWLSPPLWFLGLEQVLGGGIIARVQGATVPTSMIAVNERMLALYRRHEPSFDALAGIALVAVGSVCTVAALSYAWNLRVLPEPAPSSRRRRSGIAMMATIVCGGDMVRRAGFRFALQALMRSAPHRLSMAVAAALALAVSLALLSRSGFSPALNPAMAPGSVIAVQTVILTLLLAGFRRAVRVPAELQANWVLQISWRDAEARFLSGIKRAAIGGVAWPSLVALLPLHLWLMSERISALHLLIGACYSVVLVELLFLGCARVPFASNYEPLTNIKTLGPIVFLLFLVFTHGFTRLEQTALATRSGVAAFCLALLAVFTAARVYRYWRRPAQRRMTFDDAPEPATQWLGLSG